MRGVAVPMMQVGRMSVLVRQGRVAMRMRMAAAVSDGVSQNPSASQKESTNFRDE